MKSLSTTLFSNVALFIFFGTSCMKAALSPQAVEDKLYLYLKERNQLKNPRDAAKISEKMVNLVMQNAHRQDILRHDFKKIANESGALQIKTSTDKKLRIYTFDINGGKMKFCDMIYQFQGKDGKTYSKRTVAGVCANVFTIPIKDSTIYIIISQYQYSSQWMDMNIRCVQIKNNEINYPKLIKKSKGLANSFLFSCNPTSLDNHPERPFQIIFCSEKNKSFFVPVAITTPASEQILRVSNKHVSNDFKTYRFNGKHFVDLPGTTHINNLPIDSGASPYTASPT